MKTTKTAFGTTPENQTVSLFRLENASGAYVEIMDYGCRIMSICVPDKKGNLTDVALGLEDLDTYLKDDASLGAIVGRFANRIANGRFFLKRKGLPARHQQWSESFTWRSDRLWSACLGRQIFR